MANIPLRDYCREIENMVERGHTDEAIAHCRHILKHFPKHIETYRLLGKAFLESRQLGDAADIFQRVLSSIPDDFVSHIGMSIIREDEGNLDAAIWHMERAYEVQSSNIAIQDELRRLYGNRDGQEPPKIRLTRAALAHMYAHGHLYSQAIAELRAALKTEPNRLDLQALLAKMYRADKQQANAAKTASQLIAKLPYCLTANQVLADILTHSQRTDEAETYRLRIQELDPYYKHISTQYPSLDAIPSGVIVIEALDWDASNGGLISQPAWATSIGVDMSNTPAEEELPEWLTPSLSGEQEQEESSIGEISFDDNLAAFAGPLSDSSFDLENLQTTDSSFENIQPEEMNMQEEENDNIPDWMRDAGWAPRDPNKPEEAPPPLFDEEEAETGESDIAKASIPDWLQAMAPSDVPEQDGESISADFPDWLQDSSLSETAPSRVSDSNLLPRMGDSGESASPTPSEDLPDWLKEMGGPTPSLVSEEDTDLPDWLADSGDVVSRPSVSVDDMGESDIPDWLQEMSDEAVSSTFMTPKEQQETAHGIAEEHVESDSGEPALDELLGGSQQDEGAPSDVDWLGELGGEQDSSGVTDWLSSMEQEDVEEGAALPAADIPDWLQDLGQEIPETDELFQIEEPETQSEADRVPASFDMEDLDKDTESDLGLEDDAMAWLESLAANQGVKEEELLIKPEDREKTTLPSWLQEITEETPEASTEQVAEEEIVPEWLRDTTEEPESAIQIPEEESGDLDWSEEQILTTESEPIEPVWSEEVELTAVDELGEIAEIPETAEDDEAAMAWLEGLAAKQGVKEEELLTTPAERSEDIPDWLQGILDEELEADEEISTPIQETDLADLLEEEFELAEAEQETPPEVDEGLAPTMEESEEAPIAEVPAEPEEEVALDEDAALAWLESLAAKQGVKEEELLTAADMRPEETPDWVMSAVEEAQTEEEVTPEPALETPDEMEFLTEIVEEMREEESLEPVEMEERDSTRPIDLHEEEEVSFPISDEIPDWLADSASDMIAGAQVESLDEEIADQIEEAIPEEEADISDWILEEEPAIAEEPVEEELEIPSWPTEEEKAEEPALPIFGIEEPEDIQEEVEEVPIPVMDMEDETGAAPEILADVDLGEALSQARTTLSSGEVAVATGYYENLIKSNQNIDEVISDITEALDTRYPVDIGLWQTLGDAYVRKNNLQDALDAYTKAEELLR